MDDLYVTLVRPDDDAQLHTVGLWGDKIQGAVDQVKPNAFWVVSSWPRPAHLCRLAQGPHTHIHGTG